MTVAKYLAVCTLAACGRFDFARIADGGAGDDATTAADGDGPATTPNLVFITKQTYILAQLGSLAAADAACATEATTAGLSGTYVAWLSTSTTNAIDRLGNASGWVRLDGLPFAATKADIAAGLIDFPVLYQADHTPYTCFDNCFIATGSTGAGVYGGSTATNCNDLSDGTMGSEYNIGDPQGTTGAFSDFTNLVGGCQGGAALYCFGVDKQTAIPAPPTQTGRLAFVVEHWLPGGGVAAADTACSAAATAAGVPGSFLALLATTAASAASRFSTAGATWVRPDGVAIAATAADFMAGTMVAPPNETLDGTYVDSFIWAGALTTGDLAMTTDNCTNWTQSSGPMGMNGRTAVAETGFFGESNLNQYSEQNCNNAVIDLLCLQQ